jgi:hypothetical protein
MIVYCSDYPALSQDRLLDRSVADLFPGSGWVYALKASDSSVCSWDVAEANLQAGLWLAEDCLLVDELGSGAAARLTKLGCIPFLQTAFEAPLYAPRFYDLDAKRRFKFRMRFGLEDDLGQGDLKQFFPAFFAADPRPVLDWAARSDELVCVAGNKYRSYRLDLSTVNSGTNGARLLKHQLGLRISPAYRSAVECSLHDHRLEFLAGLADIRRLALFGQGWDDLSNLPASWRRRLHGLPACYRGRCGSKIDAIRSYRYALCIENMAMPGYVTEKIIDCLVAGVVPIYVGAPDIEAFVPPTAFVDGTGFKGCEDLLAYLDRITEAQWNDMVGQGQRFLSSTAGRRFSFEGFAESIVDLSSRLNV